MSFNFVSVQQIKWAGGGGSFPLGEIFQGYFENDLLILPLSVELDCCLCADTE